MDVFSPNGSLVLPLRRGLTCLGKLRAPWSYHYLTGLWLTKCCFSHLHLKLLMRTNNILYQPYDIITVTKPQNDLILDLICLIKQTRLKVTSTKSFPATGSECQQAGRKKDTYKAIMTFITASHSFQNK